MKQIALSIVALASLGGIAAAADISQSAPIAQPPLPFIAPPSWTGFYIGADVGGAAQNIASTPVSITNGVIINPGSTTFNGGGALAGGHAGFNFQITNFVVGVEGDFSWTDAKATSTTLGTGLSTGAVTLGTAQTSWYATIGPRLGFIVGDALIYGKGGAAWSSGTYNGATTAPLLPTTIVSPTTSSATGWMVGGGIEWRLWKNWSVKAEYEHLNFGTQNFTTVGAAQGFLPITALNTVKDTANIGKAGVNFRF